MDMRLEPTFAMEDAEHQIMADAISALVKEVANLRRDLEPAREFYSRLQTLGWFGRGMLWLASIILGIAIAWAKLVELLSGQPSKP